MTNDELRDRIRTAVRVELARRNLPQRALLSILGLTESSVSMKMTGLRAFTVAELDALATAWGIPTSTLLGETRSTVSAA